jgi:hypothetical protein
MKASRGGDGAIRVLKYQEVSNRSLKYCILHPRHFEVPSDALVLLFRSGLPGIEVRLINVVI